MKTLFIIISYIMVASLSYEAGCKGKIKKLIEIESEYLKLKNTILKIKKRALKTDLEFQKLIDSIKKNKNIKKCKIELVHTSDLGRKNVRSK